MCEAQRLNSSSRDSSNTNSSFSNLRQQWNSMSELSSRSNRPPQGSRTTNPANDGPEISVGFHFCGDIRHKKEEGCSKNLAKPTNNHRRIFKNTHRKNNRSITLNWSPIRVDTPTIQRDTTDTMRKLHLPSVRYHLKNRILTKIGNSAMNPNHYTKNPTERIH